MNEAERAYFYDDWRDAFERWYGEISATLGAFSAGLGAPAMPFVAGTRAMPRHRSPGDRAHKRLKRRRSSGRA